MSTWFSIREERKKIIWKGKQIEEVQEFKYLGFVLKRNGNYKNHIKKELSKKERRAAKIKFGDYKKEFVGMILVKCY